MANNDMVIGVAALAGIGGLIWFLSSKKRDKEITDANINAAGEDLSYGSGTLKSIQTSDLTPNKTIFRTIIRDSMTTYKIPTDELSDAQIRALGLGLYNIKDDKLQFGFIPGIERKWGTLSDKTKSLIKTTGKSAATAGASMLTGGASVVFTPAYKALTKKTSEIVKTPTQTTTYKGTSAQIAIGKTIDKVKSLFSKK